MRTTPWCNKNEFLEAYRGLFGGINTENKIDSLNLLRLWMNRGNCPHSIECTLSLMETLEMVDGEAASYNQKQLLCSISLIRFVNGLVDPLQQFSFARSIHDLAKQIDLPLKFVQIRHSATHDNLPSLTVLRQSTQEALDWLKMRYWDVVLSTLEDGNVTLSSMETRLGDVHALLSSSSSSSDCSTNDSQWSAATKFEPSAIGMLGSKKSNLYL